MGLGGSLSTAHRVHFTLPNPQPPIPSPQSNYVPTTNPPSTEMTVPVTNAAASDASHT
jgi:hypothetical protein